MTNDYQAAAQWEQERLTQRDDGGTSERCIYCYQGKSQVDKVHLHVGIKYKLRCAHDHSHDALHVLHNTKYSQIETILNERSFRYFIAKKVRSFKL